MPKKIERLASTPTWSTLEVARRLGVSRRTIERASEQGVLPFVTIWRGGTPFRRYTDENIRAYTDKLIRSSDEHRMWNIPETAAKLGLTTRTIERASERGLLPYTLVRSWTGNRLIRRFSAKDIATYRRYLASTRRKAPQRNPSKPIGGTQ